MDRAEYTCIEIDGFAAESLRDVVNDTQFEQRLLASGHFRARAQRIRFPGFSLDCGTYTLPVFANGWFGERVVALALALRGERPVWLNGMHTHVGQLLTFAEGRELSIRPQSDIWQWAVLLIPRESLQRAALKRHGREVDIPATGWKPCPRVDGGNKSLQCVIRGVLRVAESWTLATPARETVAAGHWLLNAFLDAAMRGAAPKMDCPSSHQREALMQHAEAFLLSHLDSEFNGARLSATLHLSERQVQRIFHDAYGMGPFRWHMVTRLNHARSLLQQEPGLRVTDAALRTGFTHLGRFAREYRLLFGERPRDTQTTERVASESPRASRYAAEQAVRLT